MAIAKYQHFETQTIHRSEIKNAPYNPRTIDDSSRKRLKKGLRRFGLVGSLTWNKRTGNLVSGHQRLSVMDELEKTQDYELTVSVVDISEKEEMKLNVQMNNTSMMGDFDIDALTDMIELGADVDSLGFSESDIDIMFGDSEEVLTSNKRSCPFTSNGFIGRILSNTHEYKPSRFSPSSANDASRCDSSNLTQPTNSATASALPKMKESFKPLFLQSFFVEQISKSPLYEVSQLLSSTDFKPQVIALA